ncbi:MAG: LysR family transcriptional regulator [Propionibacteriales bacterium]|nr:MAG: LysR family transcriptional regulator [Propionibacteriales bacterium]
MTSPSERLQQLGIQLPKVVPPVAAYTPAIIVGDEVWTSGQLPISDGALSATGIVGAAVTEDEATEAAGVSALNALAAAASVAGGIDKIDRILRVCVYVASSPQFTRQPQVANGASKLLGEVFDSPHVRSAVGVSVLPLNAPVEVEIVARVRS